ncbi:MAG TPA: helix-turn-helix domain-containing protein [Acetobacteraceae bacterium]|jgi:DNA-binding HxlR family transcriptional regulator|nr:helix-turn-helix domain-containing protein [Acetobacteraceae bacterium]
MVKRNGGSVSMHYGLFCPIAKASEIIVERWTPLVIAELLEGSTRFSDIRRGVPLMSQTLLSQRLKELERVGIVERRGEGNRAREWHLTEAGAALGPVIQQLGEWGLRFAQDPLAESDLDVTVLVWNIRRRVDPSVFPERRVTVCFEFTDVPADRSRWWLVNDRGTAVDLCPTDPGFPVDVYVTTDIRTMIAIWFGRLAWKAGVRSGRIEVTGPRQLQSRLHSWFLLSPIRVPNDAAPRGETTVPHQGGTAAAVRQPVVLRQ